MTAVPQPAACPCTTVCVRNQDCPACRAYHQRCGSLTACERKAAQEQKPKDQPRR